VSFWAREHSKIKLTNDKFLLIVLRRYSSGGGERYFTEQRSNY
jgi:hypothetical protein